MRLFVVLLLAANGMVFAWWQGHLSPLWDPPGAAEREPERMARQIRPEAVTPAGANRQRINGTPAEAAASASTGSGR